ncbi:autotransporter-associated beta strand repeat-containing protein [Kiritimatiella glycovorans]|uniref:Autotransporter-associated beta strand repeat n=1 Tax=Kiritimatiella glycovorans TaxID=1307763 RepID=A0A0G3EDR1_9BACT|nr:autotransporter-associated beta strand repeat-containing protein [Kiritimatiella glycovorans]AKJ64473.1 autotransporter-associated beta strand repeat [Kiritimatiella glycovorans]
MKTVKLFVILVLTGAMAGAVSAATATYTNNDVGNWTNQNYWTGGDAAGGLPDADDDVVMQIISTSGAKNLGLDDARTVNSFTMDNNNGNTRLEIRTGGSLTIATGVLDGNGQAGSLQIEQNIEANADSVFTADASELFYVGLRGAANWGDTAYWTLVNGQDIDSLNTFIGQNNQPYGGVMTLETGSSLRTGQRLHLAPRDNDIQASTTEFNLDGGKLIARLGIIRDGNDEFTDGTAIFNFNSGEIEVDNAAESVIESTQGGSTLDISLGDGAGSRVIDTLGLTMRQASTARFVDQSGANGDWQKLGTGIMILQGTNTYTGDTVVDEGTLKLDETGTLSFLVEGDGVNNTIYDSADADAALVLAGEFVIDLTGAGTTVGDEWELFDYDSFQQVQISNTFSVASFTDAGSGLWTNASNGVTYEFDESDGMLTVIPEPATLGLISMAFGALFVLRRRIMR